MAANVDDILPKASDVMIRIAEAQAEKAVSHDRQKAAEKAEKEALIKKLSQPSGLSEEEKVKLAATVIKRAMDNGLLEVQVYRFPHVMCTDQGRAINQAEPDWEKTLTGIPKRSITFGTTISGKKVIRSATKSSNFRAACQATSALRSAGTKNAQLALNSK